MPKAKISRRGDAPCPLCPKVMSRGTVGIHLRKVHRGHEGNPHQCPWPDCRVILIDKKDLSSHMFLHTNPIAAPCPHAKETPNGEWLRCRTKLADRSRMWIHRRMAHGYDKDNNTSTDPWMADSDEVFDRATALGGKSKSSEVDDSQREDSTSGVAQQEAAGLDRQAPNISAKADRRNLHAEPVSDVSILEGLISIKTEEVDDSELLNYPSA